MVAIVSIKMQEKSKQTSSYIEEFPNSLWEMKIDGSISQ